MAYMSVVRVRVKPESQATIDQAARQLLAGRRVWREAGDLIETRLVRAEDGIAYALVSLWRDKAAHDRHEDAPGEQAALEQLAAVLAGPPEELDGEVVAEL